MHGKTEKTDRGTVGEKMIAIATKIEFSSTVNPT
jgi:hypothetical protein